MVDQVPPLELVQDAIEAHLSPTLHLASLPRALELLAHIASIAQKLDDEIHRILYLNSRNNDDEYVELGSAAKKSLRQVSEEMEEVVSYLWRISINLRVYHIAVVLSPDRKPTPKILQLIDCYFPEARGPTEGPSTSKPMYRSSKLYIRAMPSSVNQSYQDESRRVREWYNAVNGVNDSSANGHLPQMKKEEGAATARDALEQVKRVVKCVRNVENLLSGTTDTAPTNTAVKQEIKEEDTRDSRSPSPGQMAKVPHLTFERVKKRKSSTRISITRSVTPRTLERSLGLERTTSMMETEAMLVVAKDEEMPNQDQDPDEVVYVATKGRVEAPSIPQPDTKPTIKSGLKPKPKKHSRPSFPPREGPDHTRPLAKSTPMKRLRPHTFRLSDLGR